MGRRAAIAAQVAALEAVYREHHRTVRWLLLARGVSRDAIDDATQDVFVAIHRRLPTRDRDVPLPAWVAGIACNTAFSHRRARARRAAREGVGLTPKPAPDPEQSLGEREAWTALEAFLRGLLPEQRATFVMADVLGMTMPEIATATELPLNTLYSRLRLARARFAAEFEGGVEARSKMLERARTQGEATPAARRRTWAGLLLALPVRARTATALAPVLAIATAATIVVAVTGDRSPAMARRQTPPTAAATASTQAPRAAIMPATPPPDGTAPAAPLAASAATTSGLRPTDRGPEREYDADDLLARAVAILERATLRLRDGDPRAALDELEHHRAFLERTPLARDAAALEYRAACALAEPERALRALTRIDGANAHALAKPCAE